MTIKIKYLKEEMQKVEKIDIGDWIDLRAAEDLTIHKGEFYLIPLGIAMELPEGYEAHIAPRSSTFKNYGLIMTNSTGIVDNSYRGQWYFPAFACKDRVTINRNERICQFRIFQIQPQLEFVEVDDLMTSLRGSGRFGSTGMN